ncbi:ankyrin repeat-containing protein BDA1 [Humulus lupulus]|uniref:ankyrin repeat-containing protein BDA1 n=1 Tax=Humulus lupulus TaxID=3486 RepID=UPI002B405D28|nr:ankyrin repeat-containing protein BDA1 [Humulus lupulus]
MDTRLLKASQTGSTVMLHQLLQENPLILHTHDLFSSDNPLHVASMAGHVDFIREIVRLKPEFGKQLNEDGFSPIHIASAKGYLEIVRELLRVDQGLCRLEGRNKWTPLHFAASRGWSNLVKDFLLVCPQSLEDVTVQKETSLHLAIKNSQFEVVDVMLAWIKEKKRDDILNMRDEFGNSVLHLATWRRHRQVVEWLIGFGNTTTGGTLVVNSVNKSGLTALDLLLIFPSEAGDREIDELLRKAGAKRANDTLFSSSPSSFEYNTNQQTMETHCTSESEDDLLYFRFKKGRDSPSDARNALLVMAVLMATATFQVGINPPSGVWQDSDPNGNGTTPKHVAGSSILGSYSQVSFTLFVVFNSLGLSLSLYMITILTKNLPMQLEFQLCVTALYFTYYTGLTSMAPLNGIRTVIVVLSGVLPPTIPHLVKLTRLIIMKSKIVLQYLSKSLC